MPAEISLDFRHALRECGLKQWSFKHLDARQAESFTNAAYLDPCFCADLSQGYAAYFEAVRAKNRSWLNDIGRKGRKLARERGATRFEWHETDADRPIALFCQWKRNQLSKKGYSDMFCEQWVSSLLNLVDQSLR